MTRKELEEMEEWCRETMQEQIPDKEYLWKRIEAGLPVAHHDGASGQITVSHRNRGGRKSRLQGVLTAAACLLLVAGGVRIWQDRTQLKETELIQNEVQDMPDMEHAGADKYSVADADAGVNSNANANANADEAANPDADAGVYENKDSMGSGEQHNNAPADAAADISPGMSADAGIETTQTPLLHYEDLAVSKNQEIRNCVNPELLGVQDTYFQEADVLSRTDLFLDVRVLQGFQDAQTGEMQYLLEVIDSYGAEIAMQELTITTRSAYLLEQQHEYVLPVCQDVSGFCLASESAPQIEKTEDNQLLLHNGWQSVMCMDCTPVLCDSYGSEDYFYDRMYLTGDMAIEILLQEWEKYV